MRSRRKTSLLRVGMFAIALFANLDYLLFIINPMHADNLGMFALTALADMIAIVIFTSTWIVALYFELFRHRYYSEVDGLRASGQHLLHRRVGVFVPVVNEDRKLIRNTVASLQALRGEKEIYLLDDARKPATWQLATEMNVHYVTRTGNEFFKAGNLNNALRQTREEFVVVVDADFALRPEFIERTLPLFHDPSIAAVQTPQVYSNEENLFAKGSRYLQTVFYRYLQPGRNLLDSSFCVGTNVIYRRSALEAVGGIARVDHSEDVFTTLKFLEHGQKVFFLDEPLAMGLGPASLVAFYNQQFRWARGGLTMMFRFNTLFNRRLQLDQRLQFFFSNFFYLSGLAVAVYLVSPLLAVLLNVKPIGDAYFWEWAPKYALFFVANFVFFLSFAPRNRMQTLVLGMFSFMPYIAALSSVLLGLPQFKWKPTNAGAKGLITTLLAPYIVLVVIAVAIGIALVTGSLSFHANMLEYYFWLVVDAVIALVFIGHSYVARAQNVLPVFDSTGQVPSRPMSAPFVVAPCSAEQA
ncbi:MAG TPA: glycosyltransferase [Candidatus Dormibacteraeota bacterium]|nr:glycosyltransferase [Candidatus Dormibacteraeota bacterium]